MTILPIRGYAFEKAPQPGQKAVFGLRPENVCAAEDVKGEASPTFMMAPTLVETNGHDKYAMLEFACHEIEGRFSPGHDLNLGVPISVKFDLSNISLFDPDSGKRL